MIVNNLFSTKILGSFLIISFLAGSAFYIGKSTAQEEFESEEEEPAFKIINIPNEGILTVENDTNYKNQLTKLTANQSSELKDLGSQISIAGREDGSVILADSGNHKIQKFDASGTLLTSWGSTGMADGQFLGDIAVSVGPQGTILVADSGNHKIQKFDSNGTLVTSWRYSNETVSNEMVTQPQGEPESGEDGQSAEVTEEIIAPQSASQLILIFF